MFELKIKNCHIILDSLVSKPKLAKVNLKKSTETLI